MCKNMHIDAYWGDVNFMSLCKVLPVVHKVQFIFSNGKF